MILNYDSFKEEFPQHDPRHKVHGVYNAYISPSPEGRASQPDASENGADGSSGSGDGCSEGQIFELNAFKAANDAISLLGGKQEERDLMKKNLKELKMPFSVKNSFRAGVEKRRRH